MLSVTESWARIDAWLAKHSPVIAAQLAPPADPAEIAAAEQRMGLKLPSDLVEHLLCHNGLINSEAMFLPGRYPPFSIGRIVDHWQMNVGIQRDLDGGGPLSDDPWWHPEWVPFAGMDSDALYLDDGYMEQHYHDVGGGQSCGWISVEDYLSETAEALYSGEAVDGRFAYLDEDGELFWCEEDDTERWDGVLTRAPIGVE